MENLSHVLTLKDVEGRLDIAKKNESEEMREICMRTGVYTIEEGKRAKKLLAQRVDLENGVVYGIETDLLGKIVKDKIGPGKWEIRSFEYRGSFCLVDVLFDKEFYRHEV